MRGGLRLFAVGLAIVVSASGARAQSGVPPILEVVKGNDTGGIIPWSCEAEAMAKELAATYCGYHDKFARITSVDRQYGNYIAFNCLWRANVARHAIPEVRTRSICAVRVERLSPRVSVRY